MTTYTISSPTDMIALGQSLLKIGTKFLVHGSLGAGKTHLCKGFAQSLNISSSQVHSPTYVYYHEYEHILFHGDFYRIEDPSLFTLRGISDIIENYDYCFIERPNFSQYYADTGRHIITIEHSSIQANERNVIIQEYTYSN